MRSLNATVSAKADAPRPNSPIEFSIDEHGHMRNVRNRLAALVERLIGAGHSGGAEGSKDNVKALPPTGRLLALESAAQDANNQYSEIDDLFNRIESAIE
ncbi:hypothetical protein LJR231_001584 [Phyllobacterium sp. LjRoot231]|uniref:hypothetical protein n=1 Tax=Phyllobacterium sp. LjRoot231 TaxID=3342289 RepID=UPI003ECEE6E3